MYLEYILFHHSEAAVSVNIIKHKYIGPIL